MRMTSLCRHPAAWLASWIMTSLLFLATGCSSHREARANYLWSRGFGWHAYDNPLVHAATLKRNGDSLLGLTSNHSGRPYLLEANLRSGELRLERLPRAAAAGDLLASREQALGGVSAFAPVPPRSAELVAILQTLGLDRVATREPIRETTGSRLGRGVDTRSVGKIDPNTLPSGQTQTLNSQ